MATATASPMAYLQGRFDFQHSSALRSKFEGPLELFIRCIMNVGFFTLF